ncbi:hypothetical protein G9A89_012393 [Geosiphon pyriformis]|nr:hypothetical protein G9A89_012393 [Geosiphon pyriformis]
MEDIVPRESSTIKLSKQSTKLRLQETTNKLQQLRLNNNHYLAESAFNYYVNDKITDCLRETVNIESARENFYTELFQHTSLPRNHSFPPIIREINQTIKKYVQQQFLIMYTDKGKGRLQIPAVMSKGIQLSTWKKQRIESPLYPSYYHTFRSTINILSADASTPNATSTFGQFSFQSKQKKVESLGPYSEYFEKFKTQSPMPLGIQSPPPLPDFGISDPWKIMESEEEEEEETEDQEFTYQNLITENLEFETPNLQNQQNLNSRLVMVVYQLIPSPFNSPAELRSQNLGTGATQSLNSQNYLSLLSTPENTTTNNSGSNQQQTLINNIPPATVTNDELLVAIFPFNLKKTIKIPLFSGAALEEKPITAIYTNAKIDGHAIKLILDSGSAGSIITRQLMDQLGCQVD